MFFFSFNNKQLKFFVTFIVILVVSYFQLMLIASERLMAIKIKSASSLDHCFFYGVGIEIKLCVVARSFKGSMSIIKTMIASFLT